MAEKVAETFLQRRATWLFTGRLCCALTEITPDKRYDKLELRASGARPAAKCEG